jgi:hypothetical protein
MPDDETLIFTQRPVDSTELSAYPVSDNAEALPAMPSSSVQT